MTELEIANFVNTKSSFLMTLLKAGKDELANFLDDGIHNYLENQRIKYSQMKTFLFRNETVEFEKIYFPLKLSSDWFGSKSHTDGYRLMKKENYITIIGAAGSGKSMLMVNIFHCCIKENFKIPLLIELRNLKYHKLSLSTYIKEVILNNKIKSNDTFLNRSLENGQFVFLLDGYDEISSEEVDKVAYEIEFFVDMFPKNQFVLTTRPGTNAERIKRFNNWIVDSLDNQQIALFITQQVKLMNGTVSKNKILEDVFKVENNQFLHFLKNPLLLSMFIFVYRYNPELPKTKSKFYQNVIDTLFTKHDSITKGDSYLHDLKSKLSREEIEITLCWFSYASFFDEFFSFDEPYFNDLIKKIKTQLGFKFNDDDFLYDLKVNMSILVQDGLELKFPHRSLQEYFAAALISKQSDEIKQRIYSEKIAKIDGAEISNFLS
ncbi:MAG: NACHT domain-containing protein [Bacteroidetes bacterium]|nr:MAG: NACHT domain-containing protein [Bacteroidota bacterium]